MLSCLVELDPDEYLDLSSCTECERSLVWLEAGDGIEWTGWYKVRSIVGPSVTGSYKLMADTSGCLASSAPHVAANPMPQRARQSIIANLRAITDRLGA